MPKFLHVCCGARSKSPAPVGINTGEWAGLAATHFPTRPSLSGMAN